MQDPFIEKEMSGNKLDDTIKALLESKLSRNQGILPEGSIPQAVGHVAIGVDRINSISYRGRLR